jgi:hypothetical protein
MKFTPSDGVALRQGGGQGQHRCPAGAGSCILAGRRLMEEDAAEDSGARAPPPAAAGAGHGRGGRGSRLCRGIGSPAPESRAGLVGVGRGRGNGKPVPNWQQQEDQKNGNCCVSVRCAYPLLNA